MNLCWIIIVLFNFSILSSILILKYLCLNLYASEAFILVILSASETLFNSLMLFINLYDLLNKQELILNKFGNINNQKWKLNVTFIAS